MSTAEPFAITTDTLQALRFALGLTNHDRLRDALAVVQQVLATDAAT